MVYKSKILLLEKTFQMTISKDNYGNWKVDISDGLNPIDGTQKRHRKTGFKTKKKRL